MRSTPLPAWPALKSSRALVKRERFEDRHGGLAVGNLDLPGEGGLRAVPEGGEHLTGLVGIVIDGLLAHDDQARAFLFYQL